MGCVSSSQIAFFVPEREGVYRLQWINSTGAAAHIGTPALAAPSEPDLAKSAVKVQIVPGAGFFHEVSCIAGVKILFSGGHRHLFRFTALPSYHLIAQNHTALNPVQLTGTQPKGNQNSRFFAGINGPDRPAGLRCNSSFVSLTVPVRNTLSLFPTLWLSAKIRSKPHCHTYSILTRVRMSSAAI